jgi:Ca2+-binding RTX toxin-like protein
MGTSNYCRMGLLAGFLAGAVLCAAMLPAGAEAKKPRCLGKRATIVLPKGSNYARGTKGPDVIVIREGGVAKGFGGNDRICVGPGEVQLMGGPGNDRMLHRGAPPEDDSIPDLIEGGPGNDLLIGNRAEENFYGQAGSDTMRGGGGSDRFEGEPGDDQYSGEDGFDFLDFRTGGPVVVDLLAGTALGQGSDRIAGIETLGGSNGGDVLRGSNLGEVLYGQGGDDELFGRGGDDEVHGFDGTDFGDGGDGVDLCDVELGRISCEV